MAAFRVSYKGPSGSECPDCIVPFDSDCGECVADLAARMKNIIVAARGGGWKPHQVTITKIEYIGPWFSEKPVHVSERA